ncbi:MAG TPA: sensor domain-containing diguanylate cyclase [Gaiellaceae bacterium]|nr:sensor domain-containing diguanylate cyclase [Gaiellaceae bacterium]
MTHTDIGIAAAFGVCVLVLVVLFVVLVRRQGRRADARVDEVVRTLEVRMDELAHELAGAVVRAEEEGRRSRFLGEIAGSIDLDEVLARTLEAAAGLPCADAALIRLEGHDKPVVATLGLSAEEAERQAVAGPPDGRPARAIEILYRYHEGEPDPETLIHGGLAVPLGEGGGRAGYLTVFTRAEGRRFEDEDVRRLEELAERAGPAIENARQFREARQLADLDGLTGLHNRRYFHETLAREVARAHRYNRNAALVVFDIDDFKDVNDRIGHLAGDAVLAETAERVRDVVRSADIACRVGGDEFAVIMPESGIEQAERLFQRLREAIGGGPIGQAGRLRISAGLAGLTPDDDSVSFFERADEALYRAKDEGKGRALTADASAASARP